MKNNTASFFKGMGLGLAVGATTAYTYKMVMDNKNSLSKTAAKACRAMGCFLNDLKGMM
ncbi:MAG: hypothetical protein KBS41_05335 [Oscillospiraceae bacterium]|nr:hypothetical protein [Candidatus Equicaccousia limihippi]